MLLVGKYWSVGILCVKYSFNEHLLAQHPYMPGADLRHSL